MNHPLVRNVRRDEYDVYCGRGTPYGNPWHIGVLDREEVIQKFREWLADQPELVLQVKRELRGKRLGCHCHPLACHCDILARIANEEEDAAPPA